MIDDKVNENVIFEGPEVTDELVGKAKEQDELSPNPSGSGYLKQVITNLKPGSPDENVLYIVNGVKWKWIREKGWVRVFQDASFEIVDKGRETPVVENQAPKRRPEKIYDGPVVFKDDIYYKGQILQNSGNEPIGVAVYEVVDIAELSNDFINALKIGDIIISNAESYLVNYIDESEVNIIHFYQLANKMYTYTKVGGVWTYDATATVNLQRQLISGTNIKTINSTSILGSGDIAISGGGTQLYKHTLTLNTTYVVFCTKSTAFTSLSDIIDYYSQVKYPLYGTMTYSNSSYPIWVFPGSGGSASQITVARLKSGGVESFSIYQSEFVSDVVVAI